MSQALQILGQAIEHRRKALGLSQEITANRAEISQSYLAAVENARGNPTVGTLESIAAALDADVELHLVPRLATEQVAPTTLEATCQ